MMFIKLWRIINLNTYVSTQNKINRLKQNAYTR
jgi:hypothetical protein